MSDADKKWDRLARVALLVAVGLRVPALARPLYLDEFATLEVVTQSSLRAAMAILRSDTHHPAYFALLYAWAAISTAVPWLRGMSLLFDVGTLWVLKRELGHISRRAGLWGVALWGACPVALRFSVEIRPYAPLTFCTVLAFFAARRELARTSRIWVGIASTSAAWLALTSMHPVGIMAVAAIAVSLVSFVLVEHGAGRALASTVGRLLLPGALSLVLFACIHWLFTLDPSGTKVSWMPKMSSKLFFNVTNYIFGTDEAAPYELLGAMWPAGMVLGTVVLTALVLVALRRREGRLPAVAAVLQIAIVVMFSVVGRPIFWYRSIIPGIILAMCGAALGLSAWRRWYVSAPFALLVVWQVVCWMPRAPRAVDPTVPAANAVLAARRPGETICVFPDWMYVTLRPSLPPKEWKNVVTCGEPMAGAGINGGVALLRVDPSLVSGSGGLENQLVRMKKADAAVHDFFVFVSDDDDVYESFRASRRDIVAHITRLYPKCEVIGPNDRVLRLRCS